MRRSALVFLALIVAPVVGCDRASLPAAGPTRMERRLAEQSAPVNALHRAIDSAWEGHHDQAVAILIEAAARSPSELLLDPAPPPESEVLSRAEREDAVAIVELRGAAASRLFERMISDAMDARREGRDADADRICAALRAVIDANAAAGSGRSAHATYVGPWAALWLQRIHAACP